LFLSLRISFYCSGALRDLHSFPTRRSSDLELGRGVRLYGDGAFVAVPPYDWWDHRSTLRWVEHPDHTDLRPAPSWLLQCCHVPRSEEHTSELQSRENLVCRLLLEKKNNTTV